MILNATAIDLASLDIRMSQTGRPSRDLSVAPHNSSILIVATCWWAYVARTAQLLSQAGCRVAVLCPEGHAAFAVPMVSCFKQSAFQPIKALSNAIRAFGPAMVIPCDDRAVANLHELHRDGSQDERRLVERSLGTATHYGTTTSRVEFLALAKHLGISTPASRELGSRADLANWISTVPKPWVLKVNGAWAGEGVRIAETPQDARAAYRRLQRRLGRTRAVKRALVNRDAFWFADWFRNTATELSVQSYVDGQPANLAMFCRDGEVLAANIAEAIVCTERTGPSTIIRLIEHGDMLASARKLARELGLNGFHGLDFMLERGTGRALLIEMNPRMTSLANLRCGLQRDLIGAAAASMTGAADFTQNNVPAGAVIANFPAAWHSSQGHSQFTGAYADVPWSEPGLVQEMLQPSWPERLLLARLCRASAILAGSVRSRIANLRVSSRRPNARRVASRLPADDPACAANS